MAARAATQPFTDSPSTMVLPKSQADKVVCVLTLGVADLTSELRYVMPNI